MLKSIPSSSRRSCMSRGSLAVARSRVFAVGKNHQAARGIAASRRSASEARFHLPYMDISMAGSSAAAAAKRSAIRTPPTSRTKSWKSGPIGSAWPSQSTIGCPRRARMAAAFEAWLATMSALLGAARAARGGRPADGRCLGHGVGDDLRLGILQEALQAHLPPDPALLVASEGHIGIGQGVIGVGERAVDPDLAGADSAGQCLGPLGIPAPDLA